MSIMSADTTYINNDGLTAEQLFGSGDGLTYKYVMIKLMFNIFLDWEYKTYK